MIFLTESKPPKRSYDDIDDMHRVAEYMRQCGWMVVQVPTEVECHGQMPDAFAHLPMQPKPTLGVWGGYLPTLHHYQDVYQAALTKNIRLINTPEEHQSISEIDHSAPRLGELTAESMSVEGAGACDAVIQKLGLPLFVKGAIFSRKQDGWESCVASTREELVRLVTALQPMFHSRGRVIARRLLPLKKNGEVYFGFPISREFRVFLYKAEVIAYGFYWPFAQEGFMKLTEGEERLVLELAQKAARRFEAPYLSIDVGQTEDDRWWVIESGDPQFAGISYIQPKVMAERLTALVKQDKSL